MSLARIALLAALAMLLLDGCGDEDGETPGTTASTAPTTAATTQQGPGESEPEAEPAEQRSPEEPGNERQPLTIQETVETVLTGAAEPETICDELVTEGYVRTAYGARQGCIAAQQPGALGDSVASEEAAAVDGTEAKLTLVPRGGPYDGVTVEVELTRKGEAWRVDSLFADVPAGP